MKIVDIIESYGIKLQKSGRYFKALCPFHNESTPSFVVYPETESFYCFGCNVGGGIVHFVAQYLNIPVKTAQELIGAPQTSEAVLAQQLKKLQERGVNVKTLQLEVAVLLHSLYRRKTLTEDQLIGISKFIDDNPNETVLSQTALRLRNLAFRR